jgi:hypothetical protein
VRLLRHVHRRDIQKGPIGDAPMLANRYPFLVLHIAADFAVDEKPCQLKDVASQQRARRLTKSIQSDRHFDLISSV